MDGEPEQPEQRIELTLQLWRAGSKRQFEKYVRRLLKLVHEHRGRAERRAREVASGRRSPDTVLVLSFPSRDDVEAYLTDPRRDDLEELAAHAVARSLITSGRRHDVQDHDPVAVTYLRGPDSPDGESDQRGPDSPDGESDQRGPDSPDGESDQRGPDSPDGESDQRGPDSPDGESDQRGPDSPDGESD